MANTTGRGAQVRLDGEARQLARGAGGGRLIDSVVAKQELEAEGVYADGNRPDGTTATGLPAVDEVLTSGIVDTSNVLPRSGGALTGPLTLSGAPTQPLHAANKAFVETTAATVAASAATTAATAAAAAVVGAAPATLSTLDAIAAALNDDANVATTLTNQIAAKLALSGGTLTGPVVLSGAPTQALHPATKAWVEATVAGVAGGTGTAPVSFVAFAAGKPVQGQTVLRFLVQDGFTLPANLAGSSGLAGTAATGSAAFAVLRNGLQAASLTFAGGSLAAVGSGSVGYAVGDVFALVALSSDATLADVGFQFSGTRSTLGFGGSNTPIVTPPVVVVPPPTSTLTDKQFVAAFVADLTLGLNCERDGGPQAVTPGWLAQIKACGVTHLRFYPLTNATYGFKNRTQMAAFYDAMQLAMGAGFKCLLDLQDKCTPEELQAAGTAAFIAQCCTDIAARGWDPSRYAVGYVQEHVTEFNPAINGLNAQFIAQMRGLLPQTILICSGAYYGASARITDGAFQLMSDDRVLYTWHDYTGTTTQPSDWVGENTRMNTWAAANNVTTMCAEFGLYDTWPGELTYPAYPTVIHNFSRGAGKHRGTVWAVTGGAWYRLNVSSTDPTLRPEIVTALTEATAYIRAQSYYVPASGTGGSLPAVFGLAPTDPGASVSGAWATTITAPFPVSWVVTNADGSWVGTAAQINTTGSTTISVNFSTTGQRLRVWQTATPTNVLLSGPVTISSTATPTSITINPHDPGARAAGTWPTAVTASFPLSWVVVNGDADFTWTGPQTNIAGTGTTAIAPSFTATGQRLRVWQTSDPYNAALSGAVTIGSVATPVTTPPTLAVTSDLTGPAVGSVGSIGIMLQGQSNALFFNEDATNDKFTTMVQQLTGLTSGQVVWKALRSDFAQILNNNNHASIFSGTATYTFDNGGPKWLEPFGHTLNDPSTWANADAMSGLLAYCAEVQSAVPAGRPFLLIRMHDEDDSKRYDSGELAVYPAANREFVARWRAAMGGRATALLPVFYAPVPYASGSHDFTFKNIRAAWHADTQDAARNTYMAYGSPLDAEDRGDASHWTTAAADRIALRMGLRVARWLYENGYASNDLSWLPTFGPTITSAARVSGNDSAVDLTITHDKGTDLIVPASPRLADYEVAQNGSVIAVTAITRQSATVLRLTLASPLSAGTTVTLDYGFNLTYAGPTTQITDNWHLVSKPTAAASVTNLSAVRMILNRTRSAISVGAAIGSTAPPPATTGGITALRADALVESIGVNTHVNIKEDWSSYNSIPRVKTALQYLGVRHIRDGVPDPGWTKTEQMALSDTVKLLPIVSRDDYEQNWNKVVGWMVDYVGSVPGGLAGIEGPNEINLWPLTVGGVQTTGSNLDLGRTVQQQLWNQVRAQSSLNGVPILNLTVGNLNIDDAVSELGDMSAMCDFGTWHNYFSNGDQPRSNLTDGYTSARRIAPGKPVMITEWGYYTYVNDTSGWLGVDYEAQARLTLNGIMELQDIGIARGYLYELLDDNNDPNAAQVNTTEGSFGLFKGDGTPKPSATAIRNLINLVKDTGGSAKTFTPAALPVNFANQPANFRSKLYQQSNGTFKLVLWAAPVIWNPAGKSRIAVASTDVAVSLPRANVLLDDPLTGSHAAFPNVTTVTVPVSDHPVVVTVTPL